MMQNAALPVAGLIDQAYYFQLHSGAAASGLSALDHYLSTGWKLGYDPSTVFSTRAYLDLNPDVVASGMNPLLHYATSGAAEGRNPSPLFDRAFYLSHNADVAATQLDPLLHFMQSGAREGRNPNALFSSSAYLAANQDVRAAGMDAFTHYMRFGWQEGRSPSPGFDAAFYLANNADVAAARVNPLMHYLAHGQAEGRAPLLAITLAANIAAVAEGDSVTFTLSTAGVAAGTLYSYTLTGVQSGDVSGGVLGGTAAVDQQGRAQVIVILLADATTEGPETLRLAIAGRTADVTVLDTSKAPTNFSLTAGIDAVTGMERDDTITGLASGSLGTFDRINGGTGNDTLNITDTAAISLGVAAILSNVETANIVSAATVALDTTGWTGLQMLTVQADGSGNAVTAGAATAVNARYAHAGAGLNSLQDGSDVALVVAGSTSGAIQLGNVTAPTGRVSVSDTSTGAVAMGTITVTGGTAITVTQGAGNAVNTTTTMGAVTVNGTASTTAVSVAAAAATTASGLAAGITANAVTINDVNADSTSAVGSIASVTVANYTTLAIADNALTSLSLTGGSGNVTIANGGLTAPANLTLGLTLNGLSGGTIADSNIYTRLNITTTGQNSVLANIVDTALTSLDVSGTRSLTLASTAGLVALQSVTVTGAAGLTAALTGASITTIDTSGTTGASTISMDASRAGFTGGAGTDRVTLAATTPSRAISLGAGNDTLNITSITGAPAVAFSGGSGFDTLVMSASLAATASGSNVFAGLVTGFENLQLTGATNQTLALGTLGIAGQVTTSGGNGLTLSGFANEGTLLLSGAGTAYTVINAAFSGGANDRINLVLSDGSGAGVAFASTGLTASGVETIAITTLDSQAVASGTFLESVSLLGNSSQVITAAGNAGLNLTATSTGLTMVDASGVVLGGFGWNAGALANAATIRGSASGTNMVDFSSATKAVTYTGGTGNDDITGSNGKSNIVALGGGSNTFIGSTGNHTITAGDGTDTVVLTSGNSTVSLGNGTNAFTATSGNNTYAGGAGADTVTVGGGMNRLTLGAGADSVSLTAAGGNLKIYTTITDIGAGDRITFANLGTESFNPTKVVLGHNAVFQDYANAVVQAAGNASVNGGFGWFQFNGDTFVVESRHDGSGVNASFVNGTDMIVELSGLLDLSTASNSASATILIA